MLSDRLNHASLIDGVRLSRATTRIYDHLDTDQVDELLAQASGAGRRLIVTDGVFSMDGDIAPLDRLLELAHRHDALIYVDDAHATGVLGAGGRGTAEHFEPEGRSHHPDGDLGQGGR